MILSSPALKRRLILLICFFLLQFLRLPGGVLRLRFVFIFIILARPLRRHSQSDSLPKSDPIKHRQQFDPAAFLAITFIATPMMYSAMERLYIGAHKKKGSNLNQKKITRNLQASVRLISLIMVSSLSHHKHALSLAADSDFFTHKLDLLAIFPF